MPARVNELENGSYVVAHAVASEDIDEGQPFFESTGFGPLVFSTNSQAEAVAMAINAEIEMRESNVDIMEMASQMVQEMLDFRNRS